jgi:hypothetical protein
MHHRLQSPPLLGNPTWLARVINELPLCGDWKIKAMKILKAEFIGVSNAIVRHMVPAPPHTLSYTRNCIFSTRQPEK